MFLNNIGAGTIHDTLSDWFLVSISVVFLVRSLRVELELPQGSGSLSSRTRRIILNFGIRDFFHIFAIENKQYNYLIMETFLKILGTIAAVILAIALFPFFVAALMWIIKLIIKLIAGFTIGGFLVVLLIVLILYIIFG